MILKALAPTSDLLNTFYVLPEHLRLLVQFAYVIDSRIAVNYIVIVIHQFLLY